MIYKKGMIFKKTNTLTGIYIIGKLIEPIRPNHPTNLSQLWKVQVYVNHKYLKDKYPDFQVITIPPQSSTYNIRIFDSYEEAIAVML